MKLFLCLVGALLVAGAVCDPTPLRKLSPQEATAVTDPSKVGDDNPDLRALGPDEHHVPPPPSNYHAHEEDCDCWCDGGLPGYGTHGGMRTYNCPCMCHYGHGGKKTFWAMGCDCSCDHHHHEGRHTLYHPCTCTCY